MNKYEPTMHAATLPMMPFGTQSYSKSFLAKTGDENCLFQES